MVVSLGVSGVFCSGKFVTTVSPVVKDSDVISDVLNVDISHLSRGQQFKGRVDIRNGKPIVSGEIEQFQSDVRVAFGRLLPQMPSGQWPKPQPKEELVPVFSRLR